MKFPCPKLLTKSALEFDSDFCKFYFYFQKAIKCTIISTLTEVVQYKYNKVGVLRLIFYKQHIFDSS